MRRALQRAGGSFPTRAPTSVPRCRTMSGLTRSDDVRQITQIKTASIDKSPIVEMLWRDRQAQANAQIPLGPTRAQDTLVEKTCEDSRTTIQYLFTSDAQLREAYSDSYGEVLIGKVFEDLDALAGNIAMTHCDDDDPDTRTLNIVTASVDQIEMAPGVVSIPVHADYTLSGQVVWVGRSSMDVLIEVHQTEDVEAVTLIDPSSSRTRILSCMFTFVARDCRTGRSAGINTLAPSNPLEQRLYDERATQALLRKQMMKGNTTYHSDARITSLVERGNAVQDMPALAHPNSVLMNQTVHENTLIMQPQNVNPAGRVFGGVLMHRAYDLALATCYTFSGAYPKFKEVGEITFKKPVDIGDLVRLTSRVIYTSDSQGLLPTRAHVEVTCHVVRPEKATSFVTNSFDFIFGFDEEHRPLRRILPVRREEAERLLEASGECEQG